MTNHLPCPTVLRQLLRYEPETGKLFWKPRPMWMFSDSKRRSALHNCNHWNSTFSGKRAMTNQIQDGRHQGTIFGRQLLASRVVWAIMNGSWPIGQIDHENRDTSDDRISNLRDLTPSQNCKNRSMRADNSSGVTGVSISNRRRKWQARINIGRKRVTIGYFDCIAAAACARAIAEDVNGYHPTHGREK